MARIGTSSALVVVVAVLALAGGLQRPATADQSPPDSTGSGDSIDLLAIPSWGCVPQVRASDTQLVITGGRSLVAPVNESSWLELTGGEFALSATMRAATDEFASVDVLNAPVRRSADSWQGQTGLDLGLRNGQLTVVGFDGSTRAPTFADAFPMPPRDPGPVTLRVEARGGQLVFFAGDAEVGRKDDPGVAPAGRLFVGASAAAGNTLTLSALSIAPLGTSTLRLVPGVRSAVSQASGATLRSLATARRFLVGASVAAEPLRREDAYRELVGHEFNILTPDNALKFDSIHPAADRYNFCDADDIVGFAEANGMKVRGHTLVWHDQIPSWVTNGSFDRTQLVDILHDHISTVVGRYRGRIAYWDVVNEAVGDDGQLRDDFWLRGIGPDYVALAFQWAHEADPDALLFYNDYGAEGMGGKADGVYRFVQNLVAHGVPINGVGLQAHLRAEPTPTSDALTRNMARLAALGLQVQVTEMDVALRLPASTADLQEQASVYQRVFDACTHQTACTAFVAWNVSDGGSWIPRLNSGYGAATLFDDNLRPKAAYTALMRSLGGR